MNKIVHNPWLFASVLLFCILLSAGMRFQQYKTWGENTAAYFVGKRPMMTTLDAPYYLRTAREYNEGVYGQKVFLRGYPDSIHRLGSEGVSVPVEFHDEDKHEGVALPTAVHYQDVPLLSYLIAHLVPFFNFNYYLAGTLLVPVLASLFVLPLGIYFFRIGVPVFGLLGGLIGTFAGGYYMRSSIGRIDTDMLNLFFPVLASLLILLAGKAKTERNV